VDSPNPSLQRREATARRALLEIDDYDVTLDLDRGEETFGSQTTIRFRSQGGPTFVDLKAHSVELIVLNGDRLDPATVAHGRLPIETSVGTNELTVEATMAYRNDGEGLHRSVDPADGRHYVYGMSFLDAAPSIFACFDQPDLKAPYTFHVRAPRDWVVVGNAPGSNPEPGCWEFDRTPPLSTYFVTLVAGPYHLIRDEHDGIPLGLSARASLAPALEADAEEILTVTRQCFDEFHRLFGIRYPFGDYHQAFVPEFNAGAMENPGCVTFRDPLIFTSRATRGMRIQRATTIAHEMAHQWFGNIVTPAWWDDLWLNESFAEYLGNRVTADVTGFADAWTDNSYARRQWGLIADQAPSTHPVAGTGAEDALAALQDFDGISYVKGSSILRQLNTALGDEVFLRGTVDHFERHRFGNATMQDLLASWERAGAGDLSGFTDDWLRAAGPDTIRLDRGAGVLRRTPPAQHPAERSHTFRVALADDGSWTTHTVTVAGPETPFDAAADAVVLDPYDDTWAVVHPDAETVQALKVLLPEVTDDGLRAGIWNGVRSAFHNAAIAPADVVDLAVAALPVHDTETTPRRMGPWLCERVVPLAPPGSLVRLHRAALEVLDEVPVGSELQLSALRFAISAATDPEPLRAWLATTPDGIELDLDLRWRLWTRLAALGATDPDELDAALAAEPTSESTVAHRCALVSLPTPEAKAHAWDLFTGRVEVSSYELEAAGEGMWRVRQEHLTEPYVERYFDELPATAEVRSGWLLADAASFFFPRTSLTAGTLERAEALAREESLVPSLRRRLVDEADLLRRQLAVRQAHAQ